jgi:hypothetical protein
MKINIAVGVLISAVFVIAGNAEANDTEWQSTGATCVVYDATTASYANVTSAGAAISNIANQTAIVQCPVMIPAYKNGCPGPHGTYTWNFNVYSKSSSLSGGLTPYLLTIAKSTGLQSTVYSASTFASTTYAQHPFTVSTAFDFDNNFYWVEIYLSGTSSSIHSLYGVELVCNPT